MDLFNIIACLIGAGLIVFGVIQWLRERSNSEYGQTPAEPTPRTNQDSEYGQTPAEPTPRTNQDVEQRRQAGNG